METYQRNGAGDRPHEVHHPTSETPVEGRDKEDETQDKVVDHQTEPESGANDALMETYNG